MPGAEIMGGSIFLANDAFYIVSGGDTGLSSQYLIGNIPKLFDHQVIAGLLLALLIFSGLAWLDDFLDKRRHNQLQPKWQVVRRLILAVSFLAIWEGLLHLPYYSPPRNFIADPFTFWKANPEIARQVNGRVAGLAGVDRGRISGIFDQDWQGSKPSHTFRIAFLGDSQAISALRLQYAPGVCYPKKLENNLKEQGFSGPAGEKLQIIDAAISGYTSWQGLMLLKSDLLPLQPDLVVETFGYHDSNEAFSTDRQVMTDTAWLHNLRRLMYRSHICLLLRTLVLRHHTSTYARHDIDAVERVPQNDFVDNLQTFSKLGKIHNFQLIFVIEPYNHQFANLPAQMTPYANRVRECGQALNIPVVDAQAAFETLPEAQYKLMFVDSIHFTAAGHAFMAEIIEKELLRLNYIKVNK